MDIFRFMFMIFIIVFVKNDPFIQILAMTLA